MPTVKQLQRRLKRDVDTKEIIRDMAIPNTGKKRHEDEPEEWNLEVPDKTWDDPHEVLRIRPEDEGKRIWIADKPSTFESKLLEYHEDDDYLEVLIKDQRGDRGFESVRYLYPDEAILHPTELTEDRLSEYFEIKDLRKTS